MYNLKDLEEQILLNEKKQTIIFSEGRERKIIEVSEMLAKKNLANIILLTDGVMEYTPSNKLIKVININNYDKKNIIQEFLNIRKNKTNLEQATKLMEQANYLGTMLLQQGIGDCLVCGLTFTTADTLRPALQIIKTKPEFKIASSALIMRNQKQNFIFSDCALNVNPSSEQLADIATMACQFAKNLNVSDVECALLSYSTNGSGIGEQAEKIQQAASSLTNQKQFLIEGELQFDAAFNKEIRMKKYPNCRLKKLQPDVFIFPDLNSGNIGYKIAQQLGGFSAAGPFILGLNKPVNDLSRGASIIDIYETAVVTIYQSLKEK
ncbi:phosphotransacetylase [Spiroplasma endosymbiont of Crioceris asparagi]|uniref:phosphotransacetylase n=1 Tax=Spiroplasma endosymbiont of Crioceris asparagi TaxID=3066286 RepID=UPI0030CECAD0